ncbi:transmembrane protein 267 [Athalia rosae]|uniref:transmembrane protein 267 n=1 Tax=Athalia rosae TaxID=37344 RepID=UPI002033DEBD|nr:transmembrane protein 267 [Athalia rosae]
MRLGTEVTSFFLTIIIGVTSFTGDSLLYNLKNSTLRAISDNVTHALVGGLSWTLVITLSKNSVTRNLLGITLCFVISSLIDLDHFLLAKSWKLQDASHLGNQRPVLHCSTIPLVVLVIFEISSRILHCSSGGYYILVFITGVFSHHIRDATRRGMWFCPFGSTPPIPYYLYICIAMGLPYLIYWLMPDGIIKDNYQLLSIHAV